MARVEPPTGPGGNDSSSSSSNSGDNGLLGKGPELETVDGGMASDGGVDAGSGATIQLLDSDLLDAGVAPLPDPAAAGGEAGRQIVASFDARGGDVVLDDLTFMYDATFIRDGSDLLLVKPDGTTVLIENYFAVETPPDLVGVGGRSLTPELVESFLMPVAPGQTAALSEEQIAQAQGQSIGTVETLTGEVFAVRPDGTRVRLEAGDDVFQGDQIVTADGSSIKVEFVDGTIFTLGADARLALDEMVYDPATQSGESAFSILKGGFLFVSGQIAETNPNDMQVTTPVATIGIRGTVVTGEVAGVTGANGETFRFTVVDGEIAVSAGSETIILSENFATASGQTDEFGGTRVFQFTETAENVIARNASQFSALSQDDLRSIEQQIESSIQARTGEAVNIDLGGIVDSVRSGEGTQQDDGGDEGDGADEEEEGTDGEGGGEDSAGGDDEGDEEATGEEEAAAGEEELTEEDLAALEDGSGDTGEDQGQDDSDGEDEAGDEEDEQFDEETNVTEDQTAAGAGGNEGGGDDGDGEAGEDDSEDQADQGSGGNDAESQALDNVVAVGTGGSTITIGSGTSTSTTTNTGTQSTTQSKTSSNNDNNNVTIVPTSTPAEDLFATVGVSSPSFSPGSSSGSFVVSSSSTKSYNIDFSTLTNVSTLTITTGKGKDNIKTGASADTVNSGDGDDTVSTGAGDDKITSGDGNDTVDAGAGNDTIVGGTGKGNDTYEGGSGTDTVEYPSVSGSLTTPLFVTVDNNPNGSGNSATVTDNGAGVIDTDILTGIEIISLGAGNDQVTLNSDGIEVRGNAGNDSFTITAGGHTIDGGTGSDSVVFDMSLGDVPLGLTAAVSSTLSVFGTISGSAVSTGLSNVESVTLSDANDRISVFSLGVNVDGGAGAADQVDFSGLGSSTSFDFATGVATSNGASATFSNVEGVIGTQENDSVTISSTAQSASGGNGSDTLSFASMPVGVTLGAGTGGSIGFESDRIVDNDFSGFETLVLTGSSDRLNLSAGTLSIQAGGGNDTIILSGGQHDVSGDAGNDSFTLSGGEHDVFGGAGDDVFTISGGDHVVAGGAGTDSATFEDNGNAGLTATVSSAAATVTMTEAIGETEGPQTLNSQTIALSGVEQITLGVASDTVIVTSLETVGDGQPISVDGGSGSNGTDTVDFSNLGTGVNYAFGTGLVSSGGVSAVFSGMERFVGSNSDDSLTISATDQTASGGSGVDTLSFAGLANGVSLIEKSNGVSFDGGLLQKETTDFAGFESIVLTASDDTVSVGDADFSFNLDGGDGNDTLVLEGTESTSISAFGDGYSGFETIDFSNFSLSNSVTFEFTADQVLTNTDSGTLTIRGASTSSNNVIVSDDTWTLQSSGQDGSATFSHTNGATLIMDQTALTGAQQTTVFSPGTNSLWSNPSNWTSTFRTGSPLPSNGDVVHLDVDAGETVLFSEIGSLSLTALSGGAGTLIVNDGNLEVGNAVNMAGALEIAESGEVTVAVGGSLGFLDLEGGSLSITGGSLSVATIDLGDDARCGTGEIGGNGTLIHTGTSQHEGTVSLSADLVNAGVGTLTLQADAMILGTGTVINDGTIVGPGDESVLVETLVNNGLLDFSDEGGVTLTNTFIHNNGTIDFGDFSGDEVSQRAELRSGTTIELGGELRGENVTLGIEGDSALEVAAGETFTFTPSGLSLDFTQSGGGTLGGLGTFVVGEDATLDIKGATLDVAGFVNEGTIDLGGANGIDLDGTLDSSSGLIVDSSGTEGDIDIVSGGRLIIGAATVAGASSSNVTIDILAGGALEIAAGETVSLADSTALFRFDETNNVASTLTVAGVWDNNGLFSIFDQNSEAVVIDGDGSIVNTGTLAFDGETLNTVLKNDGATDIGGGTFVATSGTLTLDSNDTLTVGGGTTAGSIDGGTISLANGAELTGAGAVTDVAYLEVSSTSVLDMATLEVTGTLNVAGAADVTGNLDMTDGTFANSSDTDLDIRSGGVLQLGADTDFSGFTGTVEIATLGTVEIVSGETFNFGDVGIFEGRESDVLSFVSSDTRLLLNGNATLSANSEWNGLYADDSDLITTISGTGSFTNAGTMAVAHDNFLVSFTNQSGAELTIHESLTAFSAGLDNSGTISLSGGTLSASSTFTNSGEISATNQGGTITGVGVLTNTGTIGHIFSNGVIELAGVVTNTGVIRGDTDIGGIVDTTAGTLTFDDSTISVIDGGRLQIGSATSFVDGGLPGGQQSSDKIDVESGGVLQITGASGFTLTNGQTGPANWVFADGATLNLTQNLIVDGEMTGFAGSVSSTISGTGSLTVNGNLILDNDDVDVDVVNAGTLTLEGSGTTIDGALTNNGVVAFGSAATVTLEEFDGNGTFDFSASGAVITGGIIDMSDGAFLADDSSDVLTVQHATLILSSSTDLGDYGSIVLGNGATLSVAAGSTFNPVVFDPSSETNVSRVILSNGAVIDGPGTFTVDTDQTLNDATLAASGAIDNNATLSVGINGFTLNGDLNNDDGVLVIGSSGTLEVSIGGSVDLGGNISMTGGGMILAGSSLDSFNLTGTMNVNNSADADLISANFRVADGGSLVIGGASGSDGTLNITGQFSNDGFVRVDPTNTNVNGVLNVTQDFTNSGTLQVDNAATLSVGVENDGTITNTGVLRGYNPGNSEAGIIRAAEVDNTGTIQVLGDGEIAPTLLFNATKIDSTNGTLEIGDGGVMRLDGGTLLVGTNTAFEDSLGTIDFTGGGAVFDIAGGATVTNQDFHTFTFGSNTEIAGAGTFRNWSTDSALTLDGVTISGNFENDQGNEGNAGTVTIGTGATLTVDGSFQNDSTAVIQLGTGAVLDGSGTITNEARQDAPGITIGQNLTYLGDLDLTSFETMTVDGTLTGDIRFSAAAGARLSGDGDINLTGGTVSNSTTHYVANTTVTQTDDFTFDFAGGRIDLTNSTWVFGENANFSNTNGTLVVNGGSGLAVADGVDFAYDSNSMAELRIGVGAASTLSGTGTFTVADGGDFDIQSGGLSVTIGDFVNRGDIDALGTTLSLSGENFTNAGEMYVEDNATLEVAAGANLSNSGTMTLADATGTVDGKISNSGTMVLEANGGGSLGVNLVGGGTLENTGLLSVSDIDDNALSHSVVLDIENTGTIDISTNVTFGDSYSSKQLDTRDGAIVFSDDGTLTVRETLTVGSDTRLGISGEPSATIEIADGGTLDLAAGETFTITDPNAESSDGSALTLDSAGSDPDIALLDNGNVVAVWKDGNTISLKIVNPSTGAEVYSHTVTDSYLSGDELFNPTVATMSDGKFRVAYTTNTEAGGDANTVRTILFNEDGSTALNAETIATFNGTSYTYDEVKLAAVGNGIYGYYTDYTTSVGTTGISFRNESNVRVTTAADDYNNSANGVGADGEIYLASNGTDEVFGVKVYNGAIATHRSGSGKAVEFDSVSPGSGTLGPNAVAAYLSNGNVVIGYILDGNPMFQVVDPDENIVVSETAVDASGASNDQFDIYAISEGAFVVVWSESSGGDTNLYSRPYSNAGSALDSAGLITTTSGTDLDIEIVVTADGDVVPIYVDGDGQVVLFTAGGEPPGPQPELEFASGGTIGGSGVMLNEGTLSFDVTNSSVFVGQNATIENAGTLEILNGATVNFSGSLNNTGYGTIDTGGHLALDHDATNAGTLAFTSAALSIGEEDVLSNTGSILMVGGTIDMTGTLANAGTLTFETDGNGVEIANGGLLDNTGLVVLNDSNEAGGFHELLSAIDNRGTIDVGVNTAFGSSTLDLGIDLDSTDGAIRIADSQSLLVFETLSLGADSVLSGPGTIAFEDGALLNLAAGETVSVNAGTVTSAGTELDATGSDAEVAVLQNGHVVAVWQDGGSIGIKIIDPSDNSTVTSGTLPNSFGGDELKFPTVETMSDGTFRLAYAYNTSVGGTVDRVGSVVYNANGTFDQTHTQHMISGSGEVKAILGLAAMDDGDFGLAYHTGDQVNSAYFSANGSIQYGFGSGGGGDFTGEFGFGGGKSDEYLVAAIMEGNSGNEFIRVYRGFDSGQTSTVVANYPSGQLGETVDTTFLTNGRYVVAYINNGQPVFQILNASDNVTVSETVVEGTMPAGASISVDPISGNGFRITWTAEDNGELNVYSQKFTVNGTADGAMETITAASGDQTGVESAVFNDDSVISVFESEGGVILGTGDTVDTSDVPTLEFYDGSTIGGTGLLRNDGELEISDSNAIVTLAVGASFSNTGEMTVRNDGTFLANGYMANSGTLNLYGGAEIEIGDSFVNSGMVYAEGGFYFGDGTLLTNSGTIDLTAASGTTTYIEGSGTIANSGTLILDARSGGSGVDLDLDPGSQNGTVVAAGTLVNSGLLKSQMTGEAFSIEHTLYGLLDNTGGTIDIDVDFRARYESVVDTADGSIDIASGQTFELDESTLVVGDDTVLSGAGTLELSGDSFLNVADGETFTFNSASMPTIVIGSEEDATFGGTGTFVNAAGSEIVFDGAYGTLSGSYFENAGTLKVFNGASLDFESGSFDNSGTLLLLGEGNDAELYIDQDMTIDGLIKLDRINGDDESIARIYTDDGFEVGGNTLTIGGTLLSTSGINPNSNAHRLYGVFANEGTIQIAHELSLRGELDSSDGKISIATGEYLDIDGTLVVGQATELDGAGTLLIDGLLDASAGTMYGGAFVHDSSVSIVVEDGTIGGSGTFDNEALVISREDSAITGTFNNTGRLLVENGNLTIATSHFGNNDEGVEGDRGTIEVYGESGSAVLTLTDDMYNDGVLKLSGTGAGGNATVTHTSGTLINTGTIVVSTDSGVGNRVFDLDVSNQGTMDINIDTTLTAGHVLESEAGTINMDGDDLFVNGILQLGGNSRFVGSGTIQIGTGATLDVASGETASAAGSSVNFGFGSGSVLDGAGGTFKNLSTLDLTDVIVRVGGIDNDGTLTMSGDTLELNGTTTLDNDGGRLEIVATNGPAALSVSLDSTLGGIVELDTSGSDDATISVSSGNTLTMTGTLIANDSAENGNDHEVNGTIVHTGTIQANTDLDINDYLDARDAAIEVGTLGIFDVGGTLVVGDDTTLQNDGSFDVSGGNLVIADGETFTYEAAPYAVSGGQVFGTGGNQVRSADDLIVLNDGTKVVFMDDGDGEGFGFRTVPNDNVLVSTFEQLPETGSDVATSARGAALTGGGFAAVFTTVRQEEMETFIDVSVRAYDSAGDAVGSETTMTFAPADEDLQGLDVIGLSGGGFLITGQYSGGMTFIRTFDSSGAPVDSAHATNSTGTITGFDGYAAQGLTGLGSDGSETAVVYARNGAYRLQRVDSNGASTGSGVNLTSIDGAAHFAALAGGGFVAAFVDSGAIRAQQFNSDGTTNGNEILISGAFTPTQDPQVVALDNGGFAVSFSYLVSGDDIALMQIVDADGTLLGAPVGLSQFADGSVGPQLATDGTQISVASAGTDGSGTSITAFDFDPSDKNEDFTNTTIDGNGTMVLSSGELDVTGSTIDPAAFVNYGILSSSSGTLDLSSIASFDNNGEVRVTASVLQLCDNGFDNTDGTVTAIATNTDATIHFTGSTSFGGVISLVQNSGDSANATLSTANGVTLTATGTLAIGETSLAHVIDGNVIATGAVDIDGDLQVASTSVFDVKDAIIDIAADTDLDVDGVLTVGDHTALDGDGTLSIDSTGTMSVAGGETFTIGQGTVEVSSLTYVANTATPGDQADPDIVAFSDGSFWVGWDNDYDYQDEIRRFNSDGTATGTVMTVNGGGDFAASSLQLSTYGTSENVIAGYLIKDGSDAYVSYNTFTSGGASAGSDSFGILGFDGAGSPSFSALDLTDIGAALDSKALFVASLDGNIKAVIDEIGGQSRTTITVDSTANATVGAVTTKLSNGNAVIAYVDENGATDDVLAKIYDANGTLVATTTIGTTTAGNQIDVAGLSDGNFVVSWTDGTSTFASVFDNEGDAVGSSVSLAATALDSEVTAGLDGGYIGILDYGTVIGYASYDSSGSQTNSGVVASDTVSFTDGTDIAHLGDGLFTVAYGDSTAASGTTDIKVQTAGLVSSDPILALTAGATVDGDGTFAIGSAGDIDMSGATMAMGALVNDGTLTIASANGYFDTWQISGDGTLLVESGSTRGTLNLLSDLTNRAGHTIALTGESGSSNASEIRGLDNGIAMLTNEGVITSTDVSGNNLIRADIVNTGTMALANGINLTQNLDLDTSAGTITISSEQFTVEGRMTLGANTALDGSFRVLSTGSILIKSGETYAYDANDDFSFLNNGTLGGAGTLNVSTNDLDISGGTLGSGFYLDNDGTVTIAGGSIATVDGATIGGDGTLEVITNGGGNGRLHIASDSTIDAGATVRFKNGGDGVVGLIDSDAGATLTNDGTLTFDDTSSGHLIQADLVNNGRMNLNELVSHAAGYTLDSRDGTIVGTSSSEFLNASGVVIFGADTDLDAALALDSTGTLEIAAGETFVYDQSGNQAISFTSGAEIGGSGTFRNTSNSFSIESATLAGKFDNDGIVTLSDGAASIASNSFDNADGTVVVSAQDGGSPTAGTLSIDSAGVVNAGVITLDVTSGAQTAIGGPVLTSSNGQTLINTGTLISSNSGFGIESAGTIGLDITNTGTLDFTSDITLLTGADIDTRDGTFRVGNDDLSEATSVVSFLDGTLTVGTDTVFETSGTLSPGTVSIGGGGALNIATGETFTLGGTEFGPGTLNTAGSGSGDQSNTRIVRLSNGDVWVAYEDGSSGQYEVKRYDDEGTLLGSFTLNDGSYNTGKFEMSVTSSDSVAFFFHEGINGTDIVHSKLYSSSGTMIGSEVTPLGTTSAATAFDTDTYSLNQYISAYTWSGGITIGKYVDTGSPLAASTVHAPAGTVTDLAITSLQNSSHIAVAWVEDGVINMIARQYDLSALKLTSNIATVDVNNEISIDGISGGKLVLAYVTDSNVGQVKLSNASLTFTTTITLNGGAAVTNPEVVALSTGGFAVAYGVASGAVMLETFANNGTALTSPTEIQASQFYNATDFDIAATDDGGVVLSFSSDDFQSSDVFYNFVGEQAVDTVEIDLSNGGNVIGGDLIVSGTISAGNATTLSNSAITIQVGGAILGNSTLTIDTDITVHESGTIGANTLTGSGALTLDSDVTGFEFSKTDIAGDLDVTVNGAATLDDDELTIDASGGASFSLGATGTMTFSDGAKLDLDNGAVFMNGGLIQLSGTTISPGLELDSNTGGGTLVNAGTISAQNANDAIDIRSGATLSLASGTAFINSVAAITLYDGAALAFDHDYTWDGTDFTVDANVEVGAALLGGTGTLTNTGGLTQLNSINVDMAKLINQADLDLDGGTISTAFVNAAGSQNLSLQSGTLTLNDVLTNAGTLHLSDATISGTGTLVNTGDVRFSADSDLDVADNSGIDFENTGRVTLTSLDSGSNGTLMTGDFVNDGTISFFSDGNDGVTLRLGVAGDGVLTNNGLITTELTKDENVNDSFSIQGDVTAGTSGGTIHLADYIIGGPADGSLLIEGDLTLNEKSKTIIDSGDGPANTGAVLEVDGSVHFAGTFELRIRAGFSNDYDAILSDSSTGEVQRIDILNEAGDTQFGLTTLNKVIVPHFNSGAGTFSLSAETATASLSVAGTLNGDQFTDILLGSTGDDVLTSGGGGNDVMLGGSGSDTFNLSASANARFLDGGIGDIDLLYVFDTSFGQDDAWRFNNFEALDFTNVSSGNEFSLDQDFIFGASESANALLTGTGQDGEGLIIEGKAGQTLTLSDEFAWQSTGTTVTLDHDNNGSNSSYALYSADNGAKAYVDTEMQVNLNTGGFE